MKKNHAERLALWKEKQTQENKAHFRADIVRIVAMIDRNMYGFNQAEPQRNGEARISAEQSKRGGE